MTLALEETLQKRLDETNLKKDEQMVRKFWSSTVMVVIAHDERALTTLLFLSFRTGHNPKVAVEFTKFVEEDSSSSERDT